MKKEEDHSALRFEQRNVQDAVGQQENQQRNHQSRKKTREPCQWRVTMFVRVMVRVRKMWFLPRSADDIAAVQEHCGLEQSVRNQMEYGQRERPKAALHHHVAHLADRRKPEHVLDVVLRQSNRRGKQRRPRANNRDDEHGERRVRVDCRAAHDHVHAGCDHRRRVNQGIVVYRSCDGAADSGLYDTSDGNDVLGRRALS